MAITFLEKRKRLKSLIPLFAVIVLITGLIVWQGLLKKEKPSQESEETLKPTTEEIKINLQVLESPELENLLLFENTLPFEGEVGRENPFIPY